MHRMREEVLLNVESDRVASIDKIKVIGRPILFPPNALKAIVTPRGDSLYDGPEIEGR